MTSPYPVVYSPSDRISLMQNNQPFGSGTPRQLNLSALFAITENDVDNYYTIAPTIPTTISSPYISTLTDAGLSGISIFDALTSSSAALRKIMATSNKIAVTLDGTNHSVSIDFVPANVTLDSLGNVLISGIADNNVLAWNVASGKWKNLAFLLSLLGDVLIATPGNGQVLTYETASGKWKNQTPASGVTTLALLTDVTLTTPANNDFLLYETASTKWKNKTVALDLLSDATIATPADNQVLTYETASTQWKNKAAQYSTLASETDVTLATLTDKDFLIYESASSKWKNKVVPIDNLSDVIIASPANNDLLTYETASSQWKNKPAVAGVTTLAALTDVALSGLANNNYLRYNSGTSKWNNVTTIAWASVDKTGSILDDIADTTITTPANNDVLTYETASTSWKNKPSSAAVNSIPEFGILPGGLLPPIGAIWGGGIGPLYNPLSVTSATGVDTYDYVTAAEKGISTKISTTTTNHSVGVIKTPTAITQRKYNGKFSVKASSLDVSTRRYYFGFSSAASLPANTDTVLANADSGALIGYRQGTDTTYKVFVNDGLGAMSVTDSGVTVDADTPHTFYIAFDDTTPKVQWGVDDATLNNITTKIPAQTTALYNFLGHIETLTTNDRALNIYQANLYHVKV